MKVYHFDQSLIWHVVFHPGRSIWGRRFRHVSLAGYHDDTWIHLDLHRRGTSIATIYRHDDVRDYLSYLLAHYTLVKFGPSRGQSNAFMRPMSCVAFTKHVLGVRSGALRPDGLFRSLVTNFDAEVLDGKAKAAQGNSRATPATGSG